MKLLRLTTLLGFILLTACTVNETKSENLHIYTSIYPLQYTVEQIAGNMAIVQSVYPPGVDAHTYEPSSRDITKLADGDMFVYMGAGMESFTKTVADALATQKMLFVELGQHKNLFSDSANPDGHHHDVDPHIWIDPQRMVLIGEIIVDALTDIKPEQGAFFHDNFSVFKENMLALDKEYLDTLREKQQKDLLVTHAAYGYWEERYGIKQIAINGVSSTDEPSQKDLAKVAAIAKEKQLQFVIFEKNSSNRLSNVIQESIGAERLYIHNLEVLTADEMKQGENYLTLMRKNLEVLNQATK